jgi:RND superfamily putative drug exporter
VTSPYGPAGASQVSRNQKIAFATVNFDAQAQDLPSDAVTAVIHTAQAAFASTRPAATLLTPWIQA